MSIINSVGKSLIDGAAVDAEHKTVALEAALADIAEEVEHSTFEHFAGVVTVVHRTCDAGHVPTKRQQMLVNLIGECGMKLEDRDDCPSERQP